MDEQLYALHASTHTPGTGRLSDERTAELCQNVPAAPFA